jgi:DNA-binding transcriptional ArsR family regulator
MVEQHSAVLDRVFGAVADPTRRAILVSLRRHPATITEIARLFPVSLNAVSKHVKVLERAGLVHRDVVGREHYCRVEVEPLRQATAWLEHYREFWEARLDALARHLIAQRKRSTPAYRRGAHGGRARARHARRP